jgi:hypothetical protein
MKRKLARRVKIVYERRTLAFLLGLGGGDFTSSSPSSSFGAALFFEGDEAGVGVPLAFASWLLNIAAIPSLRSEIGSMNLESSLPTFPTSFDTAYLFCKFLLTVSVYSDRLEHIRFEFPRIRSYAFSYFRSPSQFRVQPSLNLFLLRKNYWHSIVKPRYLRIR